MRRAAIVPVVVLMCACCGFGQSSGLPQWKVVKAYHVVNSMAEISETTLFTAAKPEVYRVCGYMSGVATPQHAGWTVQIDWTDESGLEESIGMSIAFDEGRDYQQLLPAIFSPKPSTPVRYRIIPSNPPPQGAPYNLAIAIEKLTH